MTRVGAQAQPPFAVAVAQARAGQYQEAVATLDAAIRANPKGGENLYLLLADCHTQLADPAKAERRCAPACASILLRPSSSALGSAAIPCEGRQQRGGYLARARREMLPRDPQAKHYYAQWAYLNARERICVAQET